jgi:hypothetical protein
MAWQENGMGSAWERHGMCELALEGQIPVRFVGFLLYYEF